MDLNSLTAVSPIDGRYRKQTESLDEYFSEFALIKYRFMIEVLYFIELTRILPQLNHFKDHQVLNDLLTRVVSFNEQDALRVKEIESKTNHDVKSVEIFMRELMVDYPEEREFIHFGLTSFDVDGMARPLMLKEAHDKIILPALQEVKLCLMHLYHDWNGIVLLARTHGQPASPTRLGKEMYVFEERFDSQLNYLRNVIHSAKFGGATGNFNAHHVAYPDINWKSFAHDFVQKLGLIRTSTTTQIEPYDNVATYCNTMKQINTILIDFCRDMWTYIMLEEIKQKPKDGEFGSSAMPHKVNPIDFENAEGNLGFANAIFTHLADKLPISRLQRDLSDSTVIRNMGVPLAHTLIALKAIKKGLGKVTPNTDKINANLSDNWAVIAEAIQTILRREGFPSSYDTLKELTRTGEKITEDALHKFIETLDVNDEVKTELKALTPWNYTGIDI